MTLHPGNKLISNKFTNCKTKNARLTSVAPSTCPPPPPWGGLNYIYSPTVGVEEAGGRAAHPVSCRE